VASLLQAITGAGTRRKEGVELPAKRNGDNRDEDCEDDSAHVVTHRPPTKDARDYSDDERRTPIRARSLNRCSGTAQIRLESHQAIPQQAVNGVPTAMNPAVAPTAGNPALVSAVTASRFALASATIDAAS
jgi:hypothetical protein